MLKRMDRGETLTERASRQLEKMVLAESMRPGDRLPSESRMGEMLGVSRTVVREAIRLLSARGLVESRDGSGVYVRQLGGAMISEPIDLLLRNKSISVEDIVEVRALIEVHLAGLAAEKASKSDLQAMQETIDKLENAKLNPIQCAAIDVDFHATIAAAAGNALFAIISQSVNAVILDPIRYTFERQRNARTETIAEHSAILKFIQSHDAEGARKAMRDSLLDAPKNWKDYPAQNATEILVPRQASRKLRRT